MKTRYKAVAFTAIMVAVIVGAYAVGFNNAYQRYVNFHIDVEPGSLHTLWKIERLDGSVEYQYHQGVITLIGFDFLQDQIADSGSATTEVANVISLSSSVSVPLDSWTELPAEIITGGLERVVGAYTRLTQKSWEIEYTFTATATHTDVQLSGLQWQLAPLTNNLFGADQMDPVTLNSGEKVTVTATVTTA